MTLQYQRMTNREDIEFGINFIISHFEEPLFPRKISTFKSNNKQFLVRSKKEIIDSFIESSIVDCRINAYPHLIDYKGIPRYKPDFIMIDLDKKNDSQSCINDLKLTLYHTLKNIKEKLKGYPTVLETGGGYHIYQPVYCKTALENVIEFKEFDKPSEQLLRFAKDNLSNGKADKNNNPSFKSCLVRIPGSINSKYDNQVTIVQKWNGLRPQVTKDLLLKFRRYLIQKKIDQQKQRQKIFVERSKNKNKFVDPNYYSWIEHLIQIPIEDYRKLIIGIILAPYLINIKQLSFEESYTIIRNWLNKCNELRTVDNYRDFDYRIRYDLKNALNKGIPPMTKEKIKTDSTYSDLYQLLKNKDSNLKLTDNYISLTNLPSLS